MIVVNLAASWPRVTAGELSPADATLKSWKVDEARLERYADTILGVYRNQVVTAYDITSWSADPDEPGRIVFAGEESTRWAQLIGRPNPGAPWVRGQVWPVKYLDTGELESGTTAVTNTPAGRRAVIGNYTLVAHEDGTASVTLPADGHLSVAADTAVPQVSTPDHRRHVRTAPKGRRTIYVEHGMWREGNVIHFTFPRADATPDTGALHISLRPNETDPDMVALYAHARALLVSEGRWER